MVMHIIHVYNECESPYGVGAVAFMVSTYQERWHFVWQLVVAAADKINYYDIYVHVMPYKYYWYYVSLLFECVLPM